MQVRGGAAAHVANGADGAHVERARKPRHLAPDPAEADDAHGVALGLAAGVALPPVLALVADDTR